MHCKLRAQASFTGHSNDIGPHAPVITLELFGETFFLDKVFSFGVLARVVTKMCAL